MKHISFAFLSHAKGHYDQGWTISPQNRVISTPYDYFLISTNVLELRIQTLLFKLYCIKQLPWDFHYFNYNQQCYSRVINLKPNIKTAFHTLKISPPPFSFSMKHQVQQKTVKRIFREKAKHLPRMLLHR